MIPKGSGTEVYGRNREMETLFEKAVKIVKKNGEELIERDGADAIREKGRTDYVTEVDVRVQRQIFEALKELDPAAQFLGEEKENQGIDREGSIWILDPVDGTTNLIHDFQHSTISLAYAKGGKVRFGVVYDPFREECFTAELGKGAFLNGRPIQVSGKKRLDDCLIAMGTSPGCREHSDENFARMRRVYDRCQDIRRIGSAALELSYVACGRLDGFYEENLKIWDYAAGSLLVTEADGTMVADRPDTMACTPEIREEFQTLLKIMGV